MNAFTPWQSRVWERAIEARANGRLPHALLLCGPERLGKRALAEALARLLLCTQSPTDAACGRCASCRQFDARYQRDPVEMRPDDTPAHPAGHPGHPDARFVGFVLNEKSSPKKMYQELVIDQIRDLSSWLVLSPQHGETKVALIEPAHQLTVAAANALLKTLEEPVPGRYLLLVSDQPHRLPATIRSRCQRIDVALPSPDESLEWLRAQGFGAVDANAALEANLGHPGLALRDLQEDGAALRRAVVEDLVALASGRQRSAEVASRWLDDGLARRLHLAAEAVRDQSARSARGDAASALLSRSGLPREVPPRTLVDWFDAANRVRAQLRTTLRQDLMVGELLRLWSQSCRPSSRGAKMAPTDRIEHHRG
jgi:DNA polymerase-3 subunit delta'